MKLFIGQQVDYSIRMRVGDVDMEELRALLDELSAAGGYMEGDEEARPFSRRERGTANVRRAGAQKKATESSTRVAPGGFSTYSNVGKSEAEQNHRAYIAPLNVRLESLGGGSGGTLNRLPPLVGGAVSKGVPVLPSLPETILPPTQPTARTEESLPSAPAGKGAKIFVSQTVQQAMRVRRYAPVAAAPVLAEESGYQQANFLPVMCSRYLQPAGLTPPARWGHTLTPVGEAQLVMFGGMEVGDRRSESNVTDLMLFNTNEISWDPMGIAKGERPASRHSHTACAYEGRYLIVYGGQSVEDRRTIFGDIHMLDTHTREWRCLWSAGKDGGSKKNEPAPRYGHSMVLWRHRLCIFGGRVRKSNADASSAATATSLANSDIYVFSLSSGRWKKRIRVGGGGELASKATLPPPVANDDSADVPAPVVPTVPPPRAFHGACIKDNVLYINGGSGAETVYNDTWGVELRTGPPRWVCLHTGETADACARERHHLFACGEALLAVGGCTHSDRFHERVAEKFNNFTAVLPLFPHQMKMLTEKDSSSLPPVDGVPPSCWMPVAMGNATIAAPQKRSFGAALSGGFVYVLGGQSGSEPASNTMIRFLAIDGYTTTDARGTREGNDGALRNLLLRLREAHTLPYDVYAMTSTFGSVAGGHDVSSMVGFHKVILQQRAPKLWEKLNACRSEPLRRGVNVNGPQGAAKNTVGEPSSPKDALDDMMRGSRSTPSSISATAAPSTEGGVAVYYTTGNTRVEGLPMAVSEAQLRALAYYLYSATLPPTFVQLLEEDDEEEDTTLRREKEEASKCRSSLEVISQLGKAFGLDALVDLCDAYLSGNRRRVEKACGVSTQVLRKDLEDLLQSGRHATVTVLFVDPHTKEQTSHALHPTVLMGGSPFFTDLLRPLYLGQKLQEQIGPVAAKVTCTGPLLTSTAKRSVLVGPVSIPKIAIQPILRFLYTQVLEAPKEVAYMTMLGAHQLDLPHLQGYCEAIVAREEVNYESCCGFYHLARRHEAFLLEEMALLTAVSGFSTVRYTTGFKNLSEEERQNIEEVANELGSKSWVPPAAGARDVKPPEVYAERWASSAQV